MCNILDLNLELVDLAVEELEDLIISETVAVELCGRAFTEVSLKEISNKSN